MRTKLSTLLVALLCATASFAQVTVTTDQELHNAVQINNANIIVGADIKLSNRTLEITDNRTVTIDLGGHALDRGLKEREWNTGGQVITVRNGATLNLSNGTLKGGWGGNGGGLSNEGGTANLMNVNITGNTADDRGGAISNQGTLNMTGGSITGNTNKDGTDPKSGGGLFNYEGATATLTGITITGKQAKEKGGICNYGTLALDGCTIQNNTAMSGGGIWNKGTLSMQGTMVVTGNTGGEELADNVFLKSGAVITVGGALTGSTIGISMEQKPDVFTSGYNTYHSGVAPADIFSADLSEAWKIALNDSEAQLASSLPEDAVYYIERSWDDANKVVKNSVKVITKGGYETINSAESVDLSGFSVVRGSVTLDNINCYGKVSIILCDGAQLTVNKGIQVNDKDEASLYIYSQSYGLAMGKIISYNNNLDSAAIGSTRNEDVGLIEIHGGDIYAYSCSHGAGIGGGEGSKGAVVNIYGGKIFAHSNEEAGIGGGNGYDYTHIGQGGSLTVYDGDITATSNDGAGIGSGQGCIYKHPEYSQTYYDYSQDTGANGGTVVIHGGNIYAKGASGIGGGENSRGGHVTINGGEVYAYGNIDGAGIGSGERKCKANDFSGGRVTVNGGKVYAYGGDDGAGIGGGHDSHGADVYINGGYVYAKGDGNGAGIGSGTERVGSGGISSHTLVITGGEVYAYGGTDAAGIGGGEDADCGTVTISGGYVYAEGKDYGAGIGGGQGGDGGNVTITGGTVIAKAGHNETGMRAIGPGEGSDEYGSLTIGDEMMVSSERMAAAVERRNMCWYRTQARIEPCTHSKLTYSVSGAGLSDTHTGHCTYCTTAFTTEKHDFVDDVCNVCGTAQSSAVYTVKVYLPAQIDYADPIEYQFADGAVFNLPTAPDTYIPTVMDFVGWGIGDPKQYNNSILAKDGEEILPAGTEFIVKEDVSLTARYQYISFALADKAHNGETVAHYNGKIATYVTLDGRTLIRDGTWNTLCLPFNLDNIKGTPLEGAIVKTLESTSFNSSTGTLTLIFSHNLTQIEAGKPYVVRWTKTDDNIINPVFEFVPISFFLHPVSTATTGGPEGTTVTFVGAYSPVQISMENKQMLYMDTDSTLHHFTEETTLGSCRAHFRLKGLTTSIDPSEEGENCVKAFVLNFGIDNSNGIETIESGKWEVESEAWYDLQGRKLGGKPAVKGIYINNARKTIIE